MEKYYYTDCEGPISKNDNAFELAQEFIPNGGEFFAKLSKYDDYIALIDIETDYNAGYTLRLIVPFLKAYGVTNAAIREFSSKNILLMPGAKEALEYIQKIMPTFILSTSYRPYIDSLCDAIEFPKDNAFCTELNIDKYKMVDAEIKYLQKLHREILELPDIVIPKDEEETDDDSLRTVKRLDKIFQDYFPDMTSGRILKEVNTLGGYQKTYILESNCRKMGITIDSIMYVGDSITDSDIMEYVQDEGGVSVSFNGNRYAIEVADIACISPNAMILALLAHTYNERDKTGIIELTEQWESLKLNPEQIAIEGLQEFPTQEIDLYIVRESDREELVKKSESFRKTIRGERIGGLG
jgi:predicted HAD superfamily phosphohydrolase